MDGPGQRAVGQGMQPIPDARPSRDHLGFAQWDRALAIDHPSGEGGQDCAEVITHARYAAFQMAEVAAPPELFRRMLDLIGDLRPRQVAGC